MKTRLLAAFVLLVLAACATAPPHASGSLADKTFRQEIGKPVQSLFSPDCPVQ
jgi:hypothetical protein